MARPGGKATRADRFNRRVTLAEAFGASDENRDEEGRRILGNPDGACPHCGAAYVPKYDPDGLVAVWHAPVECCERSIERKIQGHEDEMARRRERVRANEAALIELAEQLEALPKNSPRWVEAAQREERARRGVQRQNQPHEEIIRELRADVARLTRLRADMRKGDD